MQELLTFTAAALTDFALLRWNIVGSLGYRWRAAGWSVAVAGLSLASLTGALANTSCVLAYLAGNAAGSFVAAGLHGKSRS